MPGATGVVLTTDVAIEGRHAIPAYVDNSLPIVGPARAVVIDPSIPPAGGSPIPVRLAPTGMPAVGPALPIYITAGILDSTAYTNKVKALAPGNLIAYWPFADLSGTTATDESGNSRNGTYSNVTLGQTGIGDGRTAASFTATTSYCNVYGASLATAFNGAEGTICGWFRSANAGVWTDGTTRYFMQFQVDGSNLVYIRRQTTDNQLAFVYVAGGTAKTIAPTITAPAAWFHLALTWSKSADVVLAYIDGALVSAPPQTGLGTWVGALSSTKTVIGNSTTAATQAWSGSSAHGALWNTALSAAQVAQLATVNTW